MIMKSFIEVSKDSDFPMQNIPFGVFINNGERHICTAIGGYVLDLHLLDEAGFFDSTSLKGTGVFREEYLNGFMALGRKPAREARQRIQQILSEDSSELRDNAELRKNVLIPLDKAEMAMPVKIGDYTDFYSSREHATNVGTMFRGKENALMPNWLHLPVAYHGRASSVIISGQDIIRPKGQTRPDDSKPPVFGPTKQLDFELEVGFFIGQGNNLGESIRVQNAEQHIFGLSLVNDWSARDIQKWEYVPLGPFLAKNFATTISPWIVTLDALEPFRTAGPVQEPAPMDYLKSENKTYDIILEVYLQSEKMNSPELICKSNFKYLYWSMPQQLAHHTVNGCNASTGDMMASGTISGKAKHERGSMLELTWRGTEPLKLGSGEERKFFEDGDTVIIRGYCEGNGYRIGFGEAKAKILPAV